MNDNDNDNLVNLFDGKDRKRVDIKEAPEVQPRAPQFGLTPVSPAEKAAWGEDVCGLVIEVGAVQLGQDPNGVPVIMFVAPIPPVFEAMHRRVQINPGGPAQEIAQSIRPGGKIRCIISRKALVAHYREQLEALEAQMAGPLPTPGG